MTSKQYKELLQWAESIGYKLHPALERKKVNGIYGFYATEDIKDGEVLFKSPAKETIQLDPNYHYDETIPNWVKLIHTTSVQYQLGEKCKYYPLFSAFSTLGELKKHSIYFASKDELELISKLSPVLRVLVDSMISDTNKLVESILEMDKSLKKDDVLWIALNWRSRAWDNGFIPILDLFNHSNKRGNLKYYIPETNDNYLIARGDYKKGEQVYDSYDTNDMYHYAINYNFYDSSDWKYISIPMRITFPIRNEIDSKIFEFVNKKFKTIRFKNGDVEAYRILDNTLWFTEVGPSDGLIELAKCFSYESIDDLMEGKFSYHKFDDVLNAWLNLIENSNGVNSIEVPAYQTPRLQRFYDIQISELDIISANRKWINLNSKSLKSRQIRNLRNVLFNSK